MSAPTYPGTFHRETPVGAIDGVNATYTLSRSPSVVFAFAIGGQYIDAATYSIVGTTLTFNTPLAAALAGAIFEIVYA